MTSAVLLLVSCGGVEAPLPPKPGAVKVSMREYRFDYRQPLPQGRVVVQVKNDGSVAHELELVAIPEDFPMSIDSLLSSPKPQSQAFPTVAVVSSRPPGSTAIFAVNLSPGRYAFLCFVKEASGESHARKGMRSEFRVR